MVYIDVLGCIGVTPGGRILGITSKGGRISPLQDHTLGILGDNSLQFNTKEVTFPLIGMPVCLVSALPYDQGWRQKSPGYKRPCQKNLPYLFRLFTRVFLLSLYCRLLLEAESHD